MIVFALLVAAAQAAPVAPPAPPAPPAVVASPIATLPAAKRAPHDAGLAFARVYMPADRVTELALKGARESFKRSFDTDPQGAAMEQRYPGSYKVALAATEGAVGDIYARNMPLIQDRVAGFIIQYFSAPDLAKVTAFMGSQTGQTIQQLVSDSASFERMGKSARDESGKFNLKADDITKAIDPGYIGKLTPAQISELAAFNTSPAGYRFNKVAPTLLTLVAAETTNMINQGAAETQARVMQAVAAHVRSKGKP